MTLNQTRSEKQAVQQDCVACRLAFTYMVRIFGSRPRRTFIVVRRPRICNSLINIVCWICYHTGAIVSTCLTWCKQPVGTFVETCF